MAHSDILSTLLYAARVGDVHTLTALCGGPSNAQRVDACVLEETVEYGHTECVQFLMPLSDPKANNSRALVMAAEYGHTECLKLLLPVSDPKANNSAALEAAARKGHVACVELLMPVSEPHAENHAALRMALAQGHAHCVRILVTEPQAPSKLLWLAEYGYTDIVQDMLHKYKCVATSQASTALLAAAELGHTDIVHMLIPHAGSNERLNEALHTAARNGHVACVKLLIPVSDPKANDSFALQLAVYYQQATCVEALFGVSEPCVALRGLRKKYPQCPWTELAQRIEASEQRRALTTAVADCPTVGRSVKRTKL